MYLRKIQLRHWACHDELAIELDPALNVCVGPNGTGKSTLYQAIVSALTQKHTAKGEEVRDLVPWGSDGCGPTAILDLIRRDGAWRLTKTYLHEVACGLERAGDGGAWSLHSKGKVAEAELERWLEEDGAAGRLLVALWSPQNDPTQVFESPSRSAALVPATVLERIVARFGRPDESSPFARLKQSVKREYDKSFTPVEKAVKKGSALEKARRKRAEAEARLAELEQRRDDLEAQIAAYAARRERHDVDCEERRALRRQLDEALEAHGVFQARAGELKDAEEKARALREAHRQARELHQRFQRVEQDLAVAAAARDRILEARGEAERALAAAADRLRAAEQRRRNADGRLDELLRLLEDHQRVAAALAAVQSLRAQAEQLRQESDRLRQAAEAARRDQGSAREALDTAERARAAALRAARRRELADADRAWREAGAEVARVEALRLAHERHQLRGRLTMIRDLQDQLDALGPPDDETTVPAEEALAALRRRAEDLRVQSDTLAADSLVVRLEPGRDLVVRVAVDGAGESVALTPDGPPLESRGVSSIVWEIDGVGRIAVERTSADPRARLERLERERARLAEDLAALGAADVETLAERRRRADRRRQLQGQLDLALAGESIDGLERRLEAADATLRERGLDPEEIPPTPPEPEAPLDALRRRLEEATRRLAAAQARCEGDDASAPEPAGDLRTCDEAERRWHQARERLRECEARALKADQDAFAMESQLPSVRMRLENAERDLADETHGADPEAELGEIEQQVEAVCQTLVPLNACPPVPSRESVRIVKMRLEADLARCRDEHAGAGATFHDLERQGAGADAEHAAAGRRLAELRAEHPESGDPEERSRRIEDLEVQCHRAEAEAELVRKALPPDPASIVEELQRRAKVLEERCQEGDTEVTRLRTELEVKGGEGLDSLLAVAREQCATWADECARHERDAASWALLHHLLAEVEDEQARSIAARIEALAADWVPRLTRHKVALVRLNPRTLTPVEAASDGLGLCFRIDRFSRGTREQVALACRLQIGLLLGREFRQMLLLDDPLAHTDPERHREALACLTTLAESLQVVIFTCHHDRYAPLWTEGPARRIEVHPAATG